jgi:hypothetical protein
MARTRSQVLLVDALINLVLGMALLAFPLTASWLGLPGTTSLFYPTILGAVLFGIGLALVWETIRRGTQPAGLGLGGAVAINLSGGLVLTFWLLIGDLDIPLRGHVILWMLAAALVVISVTELAARRIR